VAHPKPERDAVNRPPVRVPFFYGWVIAGTSLVVAAFSATSSQLVMGIMLKPISDEFGTTRSATAAAITIGTVAGGLLSPLAGALADRFGARYLTPAAAICASVGLFALAGMNALWQFYVAYAVVRAVSNTFLSGVTPMTSMVNWFRRMRGRTIGILGMAVPLGSAAWIFVGQLIIDSAGWRAAFAAFGLGVALVGIIPPLFLLRRRPEDVGLRPDGALATVEIAPTAASGGVSLRLAIQTSAFWAISFSMFAAILASGAIAFHMPAYLTDRGYPATVAATALSVFAVSGSVSAGLWGYLSERVSERILSIVTMVGAAAAVALLAQPDLGSIVLPVAAALGFAARGESALLNLIVARYFGRASYGRITGAMQPLNMLALGTGPLLASVSYDQRGDYAAVFAVAIVLFLAGALTISQMREPRMDKLAQHT
jgi:MFS family permease